MNEEEFAQARSSAIRAYLVGYLLGMLKNTQAALASSSTPWLADAIEGGLKEIYPLIEEEFYGGAKLSREPITKERPTQGSDLL
jgi:hypothetical protein